MKGVTIHRSKVLKILNNFLKNLIILAVLNWTVDFRSNQQVLKSLVLINTVMSKKIRMENSMRMCLVI
jgi:hypothetical protein